MPNLPRVLDKARRLAELGADHVLLHDPAGALDPGTCDKVINELREAAGVPVGLYCQGTGGNALAMAIESAQHGAEPIAAACYPVAWTLHRVAAEVLCEALTGLGIEHGVDVDQVWARLAVHRRARHVADAGAADPAADHAAHGVQPGAGRARRRARRAARATWARPTGWTRCSTRSSSVRDGLRHAAAGPAGGRHPGRPGRAPRAVRAPLGRGRRTRCADYLSRRVRHAALRAVAPRRRRSPSTPPAAGADRPRPDARASGIAASEEDLLLVALFGEDANRLLEALRGRTDRDETQTDGGFDRGEAARIRELIDMVEDVGRRGADDRG